MCWVGALAWPLPTICPPLHPTKLTGPCQTWQECSIKTCTQRTSPGTKPHFPQIATGDLHTPPGFRVLEKIAVDLLIMKSIIDSCIRVSVQIKLRIVLILFRAMAILTSRIMAVSPFVEDVRDHAYAKRSEKNLEFPCCTLHSKTIQPHLECSITVSPLVVGLSLTKTLKRCDGETAIHGYAGEDWYIYETTFRALDGYPLRVFDPVL